MNHNAKMLLVATAIFALAAVMVFPAGADADDATTHTITFESRGGTEIESLTVNDGAVAQKPTDPSMTKDGVAYTFYGWYTDKTANTEYDWSAPVTKDITLYAIWEKDLGKIYSYEVMFTSKGNNVGSCTWYFPDETSLPGEQVTKTFSDKGVYHIKQVVTNTIDDVTYTESDYFKIEIMGYPVITFESNGGSAVSPIQMTKYKVAALKPADPVREGYAFNGWFSNAALTRTYDWSTEVDKSMTLYAKWAGQVTITFNSVGGSAVASITLVEGSVASMPIDPTKADNTFAGWYTDSTYQHAFDWEQPVTESVELFAKWAPVSKTAVISFNSNGGTPVTEITVNKGQTATAPVAPTKYAYAFAGWFTDAQCTHAYSWSSAVTGNMTLYAKWNANYWTLSFSSGTTTVIPQIVVEKGTAVRAGDWATVPSLAKTGMKFAGWYTDADYKNAFSTTSVISKDTTLYAKWVSESECVVTFVTDGGSAVESRTVEKGKTVTKPKDPTKEGFKFTGWYTDDTLKTAFDWETKINGDLTLYASWEESDGNGGFFDGVGEFFEEHPVTVVAAFIALLALIVFFLSEMIPIFAIIAAIAFIVSGAGFFSLDEIVVGTKAIIGGLLRL